MCEKGTGIRNCAGDSGRYYYPNDGCRRYK
ncbi:MAG: hypothetical protein H6Q68_1905 [Firmicutes bacterium]|nr:hypothetical protein [Bacillota bacterium]